MKGYAVYNAIKQLKDQGFKKAAVARYVRNLRKEHNIRKQKNPRTYEAVPELPMGKQVQVDFGETHLQNSAGGHTKVYCVAFLLSHSRYKYAELSVFTPAPP